MEYIASAQIGMLTLWLENGRNISSRKLAGLIEAANLRGPMHCLVELAVKEAKN
ncbi:TetR-like C-terminal domain-containing protein [Hominibacterium faecale]|uniref:TetR-like C-terminal domain-containing protein n=1 Tax=Hominibacterium faecale TaxID=2839743 RepID=UPI0022B2A005|nr:TetR-like C-terminal domain-containing protein [Hominibacterium faecale]